MHFLFFFFFYTSRVSQRFWQIEVQPPFLTWYLTAQSMLQKYISSKWHSINVHIIHHFSLKYMLFLTGRNSIIFFQSCNYLQDCSDIIICWYFLNFIPINPVKLVSIQSTCYNTVEFHKTEHISVSFLSRRGHWFTNNWNTRVFICLPICKLNRSLTSLLLHQSVDIFAVM